MKRNRTKSVIAMILTAVLCLTTVCPAMGAEAVDEALTAIDAAAEEVEGKDAEEKSVEETDVPEEAASLPDESAEGQEAVEDAGDASSLDEDVIREEGETTEDQKEMPDSAASGETVSSEGYEEDVIIEDADGETAVSETMSEIVESGECGNDLTWTLDSEGTLTISGTGKMYYYEGTSQPWNDLRKSIKKVIIEKGVTSIEVKAFCFCRNLTEVTIQDSVTSIGQEAFSCCTSLTEVTIPASVTSIGDAAFSNCESLTEVTIPAGVTSIEDSVFSYCTSLTGVTIPNGVTSIGDHAFFGCENLVEVTIPASVTSIGDHAFSCCDNLIEVTIPAGVTSIGYCAFSECVNLTEVTIPDGVTSIESNAFSYCSSLKSVTIPNGVTSIEVATFNYCESLTEVTIPDSVTSIGDSAFSYCRSLTEVTIPDSVTSIGEIAFSGCESLTEVTIPDGVTSIEDDTFASCKSLTKVTIPNSVTSIGCYAFFRCESLPEVTIPESVTSIGYWAFLGCKSLTEVTIPASVTSIEYCAFTDCTSLTEVTIPDSVTSLGSSLFSGCISLTEVTIPAGVTSLEDSLFSGCSSLKSIIIPESVTHIGDEAFFECSSLQKLKIPANVDWIEEGAFQDSGLSTIYFYGPKPDLGSNVFGGVECTAYYPNTWKTVPSSTEYGGNVTWISWDPSTGILPGEETTVKAGYALGEVSNIGAGIQISLPDVLETPETCPDGFFLLRKEAGGEYGILVEYRIKNDWITPYTFEAQTYIDKNVEIGKTYSYAIQLFKGSVRGKIGPEKEITRSGLPEIRMVTGNERNRFPIYVPGGKEIGIRIDFMGEIPQELITMSENTESGGGSDMYYSGSVELKYNGKALLTAAKGSVQVSDTIFIWKIGADRLIAAKLPVNTECHLCFYDQNGKLIKDHPIRTSFERLSFCNTKEKTFESSRPGTRVLDDQLIADDLAFDFFGRSRGQYLIDHLKKGEHLGSEGLCFGMAAATDQFQAHLLSAKEHLNKEKLDLADQNDTFNYAGQSKTKTLIDLVKRQHLYQHTAKFVQKKMENMFDFSGLLDAIDDYNSGQSELMPMIWLKTGNNTHAVLAYGYQWIIQNDKVDIYVYEPGDPYGNLFSDNFDGPKYIIEITNYSSTPHWYYEEQKSIVFEGTPSNSVIGYEFSWALPDWDIFSDDPNEDYVLADISSDLVFETFNFIKRLPGNIKSFLIDDDEHSILLWFNGDGEVDLTGVCSGLTLVGSDYEYTVEGADSLVLNLETEEGGTASRVKSVTVGGNEDTVITYSFDSETDTKTFVKRLGGDDTLITVESSDPDKSTDWSEVSSEPIEDGEQLNGIAWSFDGETLTVSGKGDIPDYDSFRDTPWYSFRNKIRKVVIGEGIERIGNGAFCGTHGILYTESDPRGHDSILEVEFPSTLRSIGDSAFENCNQLKVVKLPQTFSGSIGKAAFHNCFSITTLDLGTSLTEIGEAAFKGCTKIESVTIPASVKTIADGYGMDSETGTYLAKVIPDTGAFDGCKGLKKVIYKSNADIAARMFAGCTSLTEVDVAGSPGEIGPYAFYNGKSLSSVKIPSSVTTVSEGAFDKCDALANVHYDGSREEWGKVSILTDNEALQKASIHYAEEAVALGKTTRGDMFNLANNVKVTWKEVPGAKYYKVYREGVTDKKESQKDPVIVTTGLIGWDKLPGLTNGHAYRYRIVASLTGKGDPSGDSKLSYSKLMYRLKTVVIRSAKNTSPGKVTVKYDKTTSGDSYVLQYCEREDMVGAKTKVVLGASNTSYVIGGLKKGKTYYISIRVRKKVNGIDYYTTFGVPKKVTISK